MTAPPPQADLVYLETAFTHLQFAIKLWHFVKSGAMKVEAIDVPLRIEEGRSVLVLPDRILSSQDDLILACENHVSLAFGGAAITLGRCREDAGLKNVPDPTTEVEQWVALVHQIRNALGRQRKVRVQWARNQTRTTV